MEGYRMSEKKDVGQINYEAWRDGLIQVGGERKAKVCEINMPKVNKANIQSIAKEIISK